jgi:hypothetical protein
MAIQGRHKHLPFRCQGCGNGYPDEQSLHRHQSWCLPRDLFIELYPKSNKAVTREARLNKLRRFGYDHPQ